MIDLAELRIRVDTSDVKRAATETVQAAGAMGRAVDQHTARIANQSRFQQQLAQDMAKVSAAAKRMDEVQRQAGASAQAYAARLERDFTRALADIKEAAARGLLTPQEAQARGAAAAQAYNAGLLREMDRLGGAGGFQGARGQALFVGLAGQLKEVDAVAAKAGTGGLRTMTTGLATLAAQELGMRSGMGSLISSVSFFGLGALTSLGVVAGLAALAVGISSMTEASRKADREMEALLDRIRQLRDERFRSLAQDAQDLTEGLVQARQKLADLVALRAQMSTLPGAGGFVELILGGKIAGQSALVREMEGLLTVAKLARDAALDDQAEQARERARTSAEQHAAALERMNQALVAQLGLNEDLVRSYDRLVPNLIVAADVAQRIAGIEGAFRARQTPLIAPAPPPFTQDAAFLGWNTGKPKGMEAVERERQQTMRDALQLQVSLLGALKGASGLSDELTGLASVLLTAQKAMQGLAGASDGFILAAASLAASLISASRQRAEQQVASFKSWVDSREAFINTTIPGFIAQGQNLTPEQQALQRLEEQFRTLMAEAEKLQLPIDKLTAAYEAQKLAIQAAFQEQQRQFRADLEVRRLSAEGYADEAATLRLRLEQQREYADAVKQGYDAATLAALSHVHALEEEVAIRERARQEIDRAFGKQAGAATLAEAQADLRGDPFGAAQARFQGRINDVNRRFSNGELTREEADAWLVVFAGQFDQEIKKLTEDAKAAADALAAMNANLQQDAALRILGAQATISGLEADREAYEDARRHANQQKEIDEAIANGATDATLASVRLAQQWEDQAVVAQRAQAAHKLLSDEMERQAALAKAQAASTQDLQVRLLRAQGFGTQADDLQRSIDQAREVERFTEQGFSSDFLDLLKRVQSAESDRALMDRAIADVTAPAGGGGVTRYSDNTVGLLQRSEALQQSMVVYLAQIAANTAGGYQNAGATVPAVVTSALTGAQDRLLSRRAAIKQSAAGAYRPL